MYVEANQQVRPHLMALVPHDPGKRVDLLLYTAAQRPERFVCVVQEIAGFKDFRIADLIHGIRFLLLDVACGEHSHVRGLHSSVTFLKAGLPSVNLARFTTSNMRG